MDFFEIARRTIDFAYLRFASVRLEAVELLEPLPVELDFESRVERLLEPATS